MKRFRNCWKLVLLSIGLVCLFATTSYGLDVTLAWDANTEPDLAGYKIYYDTDSGHPYEGIGAQQGNSPIDMSLFQDEDPDPNTVQYTVYNLPVGTYYFAVTAYDNEVPSLESAYSNEVNTSSSSDTTPPIVSNVQVTSTTDTTAVIVWTTDEASNSQVEYGIMSGEYPNNISNNDMVTNHSMTLTSLEPFTTYYFRVASTDASGNGPTTSDELHFTTDLAPDTDPPIVTYVQVASTTESTAVITWTTDEPADSEVQYGTASTTWGNYPYNNTEDSMVTGHSVTLVGLNGGTRYYFRVGSRDASENGPTTSNEFSFITASASDYTVEGIPVDLEGSTPESEEVVLTLHGIPLGTTAIDLVMRVLDADFSSEGRLYINGQGPIALFGAQGIGAHNNVSVTLDPIRTDRAWYQLGQNILTFWHDSTVGFVIENISVTFVTESADNVHPKGLRIDSGMVD